MLAASCSTRVTTTPGPEAAASSARLPRPQHVLVADFELSRVQVQLDQGVGARLQRLASTADQTVLDQEKAASVQQALSETLISDIRKMGMPASRLVPGSVPEPGDLLVTGQISKIDEGNRTRRLAVGFGAGMSDVSGAAQLSLVRAGEPPEVLQTYSGSSDSGHKPGLALGAASSAAESSLAPAALTAVTGAHAEQTRTGVEGEAQRIANRLAVSLGTFFAEQNWIPESAVPTPSLR